MSVERKILFLRSKIIYKNEKGSVLLSSSIFSMYFFDTFYKKFSMFLELFDSQGFVLIMTTLHLPPVMSGESQKQPGYMV